MTYEVRVQFEGNGVTDTRKIDFTDRATAIEFATKNGEEQVKYLKVGKKRWTWQSTPSEDQFKKLYRHLKNMALTIKEVETGKVIYRYSVER